MSKNSLHLLQRSLNYLLLLLHGRQILLQGNLCFHESTSPSEKLDNYYTSEHGFPMMYLFLPEHIHFDMPQSDPWLAQSELIAPELPVEASTAPLVSCYPAPLDRNQPEINTGFQSDLVLERK
jgi:hypothetical protein